jgi:hypothetical protein
MQALFWFIGVGLVAANLAAANWGPPTGIRGMVTIDILAAIAIAIVLVARLLRRAARPAQRVVSALSNQADEIAVDVAARGLRAGRKINGAAKTFADRVRKRADGSS